MSVLRSNLETAGNLGRLQLNIPWRNFNTPLTAEIDDLFLLVNPAVSGKVCRQLPSVYYYNSFLSFKYDPEDDEKRSQAVKQERLRTAETLQMQGQTDVTEGIQRKTEPRHGLISSFQTR